MTKLSVDFRYVEFEYELLALRHMLLAIEPTIERLSAENEEETLAELRANGWDHDEAELDMAFQGIRDVRDFMLPRFLRGPFVVSLSACFEAAVSAVALELHDELGASSTLAEERRGSFPSRARRYFQEVLRVPLESEPARFDRLVDLYAIRNALAHANGLKEGMSPKGWKKLEMAAAGHAIELHQHRGALMLTQKYVESAYEDVNDCLRSLVARARLQRRSMSGPSH
jgi:hypothetical protein